MLVTKEFKFDAAHHLTKYHGKCENVHGHTYKLQVTVEGDLNEDDLVLDFCELKEIVNKNVLNNLDHTDLNEMFENPSTELVAKWIWEKVEPELPENVKLHDIKLWETETSFVTYEGN